MKSVHIRAGMKEKLLSGKTTVFQNRNKIQEISLKFDFGHKDGFSALSWRAFLEGGRDIMGRVRAAARGLASTGREADEARFGIWK